MTAVVDVENNRGNAAVPPKCRFNEEDDLILLTRANFDRRTEEDKGILLNSGMR